MPSIDPNLTIEAHISSNELIFQIDTHSESYLSFLSILYQTYEHVPNPISLPKSIKVVHKNLRTDDDRICVYSSNEHICVTFSGGLSVRQEILENGMKEFYVKNNWRNEFRLNVMHTFVENESVVEIEKLLF
uniref:Galectin n=1 Tax=Acrobeloides nanus TaxID=290746 RepID=A0A914D4J4_9BILA